MYNSKEEIREELLSEWDSIHETSRVEDLLLELSESFVPVYNHEIIKDWSEMPSEFEDSWKDSYNEVPEEVGIIGLMRTDLSNYYYDTTFDIYYELRKEKGEDE